MDRTHSLLLAAVAAVATACGSSTTAPPQRPYDIAFQRDSEQQYSPARFTPSCSPADMYCKVWGASSGELAGSLDLATSTLTIDGVTYSGSGIHLDSLPNSLTYAKGCGDLQIRASLENGVVRGTWNQVIDCHDRRRAGSFTSR